MRNAGGNQTALVGISVMALDEKLMFTFLLRQVLSLGRLVVVKPVSRHLFLCEYHSANLLNNLVKSYDRIGLLQTVFSMSCAPR